MIGKAPADQRQQAVLADEAAVALVVGMDGDCGVGEHRLRANGRNREHLVGALDRVVDLVEEFGDLAVLDLEIRDRRSARPGSQSTM